MSDQTLYTIGYGNKRIDRFDALMSSIPNAVLIDCRRNPVCQWSRDFTKAGLQARYGDRYYHAAILGNDITAREADTLTWIPNRTTWEAIDAFLQKLHDRLEAKGLVPVFMCSEFDWRRCHRQFIVERALRGAWQGYACKHVS